MAVKIIISSLVHCATAKAKAARGSSSGFVGGWSFVVNLTARKQNADKLMLPLMESGKVLPFLLRLTVPFTDENSPFTDGNRPVAKNSKYAVT